MKEFKPSKKNLTIILLLLTGVNRVFAQNSSINYNQLSGQELNSRLNTITTAVPFLLISPDSRAGGMGDAGCATSTDPNSIHWNASKLAFADKKMGIAV